MLLAFFSAFLASRAAAFAASFSVVVGLRIHSPRARPPFTTR